MRRISCALVWVLLVAASVRGQTNDHVYRDWRWEEDPGSPRAAGLAGAFTAIADDASASLLNPAGLADHARSEAMGSLLRRGSGAFSSGDTLASATGLGLLGGSVALGTRFAIGAQWSEPRDASLTLGTRPLPDSTYDAGFLDAQMRTLSVAAGYSVTHRLHLGAGLLAGRLELQGRDSVLRARGDTLTQVDASATDTAIRATFGALYDVTPDLKVGVAARTGASFEIARSAYSPAEGRTVDRGSVYRLRAPDSYSAAAVLRLPGHFRVTGQADFVRYSQIRDALDVRRDLNRADYVLEDGVEGRFGVEWARAFDPLTLQLRAGLWNQAPGSVEYVGPDPSERMTFQGSSRRWREGVGASVLLKSGLSVDTGALFGGDQTLILAGARYAWH